ncbi:thiamine pyrophosphate-dependent enzyme [Paenarthrobacter aurescens]|uniref:Thiamine pyrophosphate protein n=1 Tax=Paenarthrobacter aurescens TaxID=43663 RepID=A0A4Y3NES3_PAEAU|nr:thiamine pyrophosphate-dependent enzyme [Paenarthrobacter aurescens]MDO6142356.1 acetolactate synthase [Paenarthrobacter aurescens]MDO6146203.1 acetolactate synthase [Paenarthrobacter aurescens]MDO6157448.1 acetolactate synthase [Paenarthrobacter aurescens]MDO6161433.1 acetolactate synthase [Paenarthrobacter aurescens]GEB18925.1 thiamine pyrophosphate protein [Paenarthrobacter aurescens]
MSTTTAGHLIVGQLERAGINRVYTVPGESFLDVLDGLHGSPIQNVVARQEGGAGFMALAEGRLTELPGVAMVTRGPGAANAFIAIHTAYQDATPLILFVGLIPVADRGRESFQEFDINAWFGSTAKKVVTLDDAASAARVVDDAIFTALSGRPGPVVIGLPEDVLVHVVENATVEPRKVARPEPAAADLSGLTQKLEKARKPLIVVGGEGWTQDSGEQLSAWASRNSIPVVADFRAYDAVPHRSDAYAGFLGYGRSDANAQRLDDADLIVFVGCVRGDVLSDGYKRGLDAETVVVNADANLLGHFGRVDQHIIADVTAFAAALPATAVEANREEGWFASARADQLAFSTPAPDGGIGVDLGVAMEVLKKEMADNAVLTFGAGNHALWPARYLDHNSANSLAAPRNGAMGMGIPAAVAASLAYPGRQVISVAGDGCFMMNGQEIATAMGYGATFIVLVVDNGIFATIREHQEAHYPDRPSGTHMTNPDFAALARSYGGYGERVDRTEDFAAAFRRAVDSGLPALLHLPQDPTTRSPKTSTH